MTDLSRDDFKALWGGNAPEDVCQECGMPADQQVAFARDGGRVRQFCERHLLMWLSFRDGPATWDMFDAMRDAS